MMDKHKIDEKDLDFRRDVDPNSVYELTSLLGEGSYGAVYRARAREVKSNAEEVAIKIIPDADDDLTALWREIRFLQVLRSPFVVSFIESLLYDNELWLVMELCDGGSLYDLKEAKKIPFTEPELKAIMSFCTLGLAHLHAQMSIHRDVKSGNVLLTRDGRAKLGDFGISAQLTDTIMKRRTVIGSPYWMAPEVIQETSYDGKADIWSLGITLLELCEGSPPHFNVHPMRAIFIISSRPPPTLKEPEKWSADMRDFVSKCLVKDCEARASSAELLQHPWLRRTIMTIGSHGQPLPELQDLVQANWDTMERLRASKYKENVGEEEGTMRPGSTQGREGYGIPATRQQIRNASLKRGTFSMDENAGTLVRNRASSYQAPLGAEATLRRVTPQHTFYSDFKDQDEGTLKRSIVPSDDLNNTRITSVLRNPDGGEAKGAQKGEIQAALRYFRDEPLPPPPDAKGIAKERQVKDSPAPQQADHSKASYQAEVAILEELSAQPQQQSFPHEELKKEIMKQLSVLKKQYREDLEVLTRSYEQRRKALKDALLTLSEAPQGKK